MAKVRVLIYHCEHGHEVTYPEGKSTPAVRCPALIRGKQCDRPLVSGGVKGRRKTAFDLD